MIINKKLFKIATGLAILPMCFNSFAATQQFTGTFKTIKDVSINEITPLVINGLYPAANSDCIINTPAAGTTAFPGEIVMKMANTAGTYLPGAGTAYGLSTSTTLGCSLDTASVPGIYEIDGAAGASVDVEIIEGTAGGVTFTPAGCAVTHVSGADNDTCEVLAEGVGSGVTVLLASSTDLTNSAGGGTPELGKSMVAIGGTATADIGLTAGASVVVAFDINVTY